MSVFNSCIYESKVFHKRVKPKSHRLRYGVFYLLLDVDELDSLHRRLSWFSVNSFNVFSFYDRDHGPGTDVPLRLWIENQLALADVEADGGKIEILCMPRIFGYVFNPITVYYCYDRNDVLKAILYEVSNTFGQRHSYLARIEVSSAGDRGALLRHSCDKRFYVSPFLEVVGRYDFSIRRPNELLFIHIHQTDAEGSILDAWVKGTKSSLSDRRLIGTLVRYPLLTLKVIGGIHWEALKLWTKGIGLKTRPSPPTTPVTVMQKRNQQ